VFSFGVAAYQAREAAHVRQDQERKDELLRGLAQEEVREALNELVDPFKRIFDLTGLPQSPTSDPAGQVIDRHLYRATDRLDKIGSEAFLGVLDKTKALDCPREFARQPGCTWARMIGIAASNGDEHLRLVATRYAAVLSPSALALIQSIRTHKMLDILKSTPGNVEVNRDLGKQDLSEMTIGWLLRGPHEPATYYLPFFTLLKRLYDESGRKREDPDRWWLPKPTKEAASICLTTGCSGRRLALLGAAAEPARSAAEP
jgi:hypothetical protein